jgi:hypothetical protein
MLQTLKSVTDFNTATMQMVVTVSQQAAADHLHRHIRSLRAWHAAAAAASCRYEVPPTWLHLAEVKPTLTQAGLQQHCYHHNSLLPETCTAAHMKLNYGSYWLGQPLAPSHDITQSTRKVCFCCYRPCCTTIFASQPRIKCIHVFTHLNPAKARLATKTSTVDSDYLETKPWTMRAPVVLLYFTATYVWLSGTASPNTSNFTWPPTPA